MSVKKCTKCNKVKSMDKFDVCKGMPDGHYDWCTSCINKHRNIYKIGPSALTELGWVIHSYLLHYCYKTNKRILSTTNKLREFRNTIQALYYIWKFRNSLTVVIDDVPSKKVKRFNISSMGCIIIRTEKK